MKIAPDQPHDVHFEVRNGATSHHGIIPGVTEGQMEEAARLALITHHGECFSKRLVGPAFGSIEKFLEIQKEMIARHLLIKAGKGRNAGYKLTPSGVVFLSNYLTPLPQ
jgi:predicted transcriptional regulator